MSAFLGDEIALGGVDPDFDRQDEANVERQTKPHGFSDPEVLARAQATRVENREARAGVEQPTTDGAKRRGRPPGAAKEKRDLDGIIMLLVGVHQMIATATGFEDLTIDREEGGLLARALADLSEQYKIKLTGKTAAAMGLLYAMVTVYGPRAFLIRQKLQERNKGVQAGGASSYSNVRTFSPA